jgi:transposase InsO family protein
MSGFCSRRSVRILEGFHKPGDRDATAASKRPLPTANGSPTSRMCGQRRVGSNVAAVVDLFSGRVVGWSMNAAMTAQLVTDALVMAIWRRGKPDALLHHSDRGSQKFQWLMADHGSSAR